MVTSRDIIGLDIGHKRIGVARASTIARLPEPLEIINTDESAFVRIKQICEQNNSRHIVVGLPHNMSGQETAQTKAILEFVHRLTNFLGDEYTVDTVDESLSSVLAHERYPKLKHIDDKAAAIILENYLETYVS